MTPLLTVSRGLLPHPTHLQPQHHVSQEVVLAFVLPGLLKDPASGGVREGDGSGGSLPPPAPTEDRACSPATRGRVCRGGEQKEPPVLPWEPRTTHLRSPCRSVSSPSFCLTDSTVSRSLVRQTLSWRLRECPGSPHPHSRGRSSPHVQMKTRVSYVLKLPVGRRGHGPRALEGRPSPRPDPHSHPLALAPTRPQPTPARGLSPVPPLEKS